MKAQIIDVASFMPERTVVNEPPEASGQDALADNAFFSGVNERRFASPDYLSEDLGVRAVERLLEKTGVRPETLDLIVCSCIFSDTFWPGIGPAIQHRVGAKQATILNLDTNCSSYLSGLNTASFPTVPVLARTRKSLAREAGLSRAAFARRFTAELGEPPLAYLTRWRMGAGVADPAPGRGLPGRGGAPGGVRIGVRLPPGLQAQPGGWPRPRSGEAGRGRPRRRRRERAGKGGRGGGGIGPERCHMKAGRREDH
ncbi:hypothetical protein WMF28_06260 [Sorangium sp. So ce590]|uniref:hypothetical protein n=1 Tax=Sorangium sp. So ce590 TaxID=3133317 RepID=UPI003F5F1262